MRFATAAIAVVTILSANLLASDLPQYSLLAGRQLTYSGRSDYRYEITNRPSVMSSQLMSLRLTVVARNADGSCRIVVRSTEQQIPTATSAATTQPDEPERVNFYQIDVRPDGALMGSAGGFMPDAPVVLPVLPSDDREMAATWQSESRLPGQTTIFHSTGAPTGADWKFAAAASGLFKDIYGMSADTTFCFDISKGIITRMDSQVQRNGQIKGSGTQNLSLQQDEMLSPQRVDSLARDCAALFAAQAVLDAKTDAIQKSPDDAARLGAEIRAAVATSAANVTTPEIKTQFDQLRAGIDRDVQSAAEDGKRFAAVIGKPAFDFSAADLDGKAHKLSEYRGKVVLLDFWYRGCGWCMRAMPQMKLVADDFRDKPVAVLGLNTDPDVNDAKFVVDALKLNYTVLRIDQDTVSKFNVRGFPSLLIIDGRGIVRSFDEGYSPTLRVDLDKKVQSLLDSTTAVSHAAAQ
jgi:thiol-disulfide isomerase/thioredoxin